MCVHFFKNTWWSIVCNSGNFIMEAFPAKFMPELNQSNIISKTSIIFMILCSGNCV